MLKTQKSRIIKKMAGLLSALFLVIAVPLSAAEWDNYKARNYHNLIKSDQPVEKLKELLKKDRVFLMVSGCHLDGEAMPAFIKISKKYPKATFIRISQFGKTKDFMNRRFLSYGAPKIYAFGNNSLVGQMYHAFTFKSGRRFLGWEKSMEEWSAKIYPILDEMASSKNLIGISSFSPQSIYNERLVLIRANIRASNFEKSITTLINLARKNPRKKFAVDTMTIDYNQPFMYRYMKTSYGISVIENHRIYAVRRGYNANLLNDWLSQNYKNSKPLFLAKSDASEPAHIRDAIKRFDSYTLATAQVRAIQAYRKSNRKPYFVQNFYVILNAVNDPDRKKESVKELLQLLYFKEAGGIKKMVQSPILRKKTYRVILEKKAENETDPQIKKELENLAKAYNQ